VLTSTTAVPLTKPIQHTPTGVLVLLVLVWSMLGPKIAQRTPHLTEGSAACLLGLTTGLVLLVFSSHSGVAERMLEFNAGGFFTYLLPPIIFNCGLSVERHRFFLNLPSILMFGVLGTITSFVITGARVGVVGVCGGGGGRPLRV